MADENARSAPDGTSALFAAALGAASKSEKVDALIERQIALADLQIEDIKREDKLRHWSLRVRHISDMMKLTFELSVAAIVLAFAVLIGTAMWKAAHDHSLVIESFSVPGDMAARGITGQAVAALLQDKLTTMQARTDSARPADSYANNWGADIKVQIPDTGVSVGEFYQLLVSWFGDQTHISGEMYRTADGLAVTTRASGEAGDTVLGSEHDLDALMQKAAEAVYARTQKFRYAIYLVRTSQQGEKDSLAIQRTLALSGSLRDRIWAYMGLGTYEQLSNPANASNIFARAIPLAPKFALPYQNIANAELSSGHSEAALAAGQKDIALLAHGDGEMSTRASAISLPAGRASMAEMLGDFGEGLRQNARCVLEPDYAGIAEACGASAALDQASQHDWRAARSTWSDIVAPMDPIGAVQYHPFEVNLSYAMNDWSAVTRQSGAFETFLKSIESTPPFTKAFASFTLSRRVWPYTAAAMAHNGDMPGALALIGKTPLDCDVCVRMRGNIAAMNHDWAGAAHWFAMVSARTPSIPFADTDWGAMLLAKGDYDGAIAKFDAANKISPHFADPLEMWGEALMAKNRSDLALAKFAEADKYAPNWGRLHLKWGEALMYSGNKDAARAQLAIADRLDLTAAEHAERLRFRL
jgi:tetratricopeptide (TPR) repeat protein